MAVLYVDLTRPVHCPICRATSPNMLFPHPLGYDFYCAACGHEERILRDENGRWFWFANRIEDLPEARPVLAKGAAS